MTPRPKKVCHHAILIGINAYTDDSGRISPLKGCVHDVEEISRALRGSVDNVSVHAFTATTNPDRSPSQPACMEPRESWPTHDNISACFEQVIQQGQRGDHVYIHYSGHSTVVEPSVAHSNWDNGDLSLVVLEGPTASETRYFRGTELADSLRKMVDAGLGVTMVLDCCYSGSALRNDDTVRFAPYCSEVDKKYPPKQRKEVPGEKGMSPSQSTSRCQRQISMRDNWLVNPDGYAILTSSSATERAYEVPFDKSKDSIRHGTLTYFLLETFDMLGGVGGSMEYLSESIRVRVNDHRRHHHRKIQTATLFGNKKQFFFGCPRPGCCGDIPVTKIAGSDEPGLRLHAGQAHGIFKGDRFSLHPLGARFPPAIEATVTAEAVDVRGITSDLKLVEGSASSVKTGWLATAVTRLSLQQFPIALNVFKGHLTEWQEAIGRRESLREHYEVGGAAGPGRWSFSIVQTSDMDYNIYDESDESKALTTVTVAEGSERKQQLLNQVQHLASFKLVRDLVNTAVSSQFTDSFNVHIVKYDGNRREIFNPGCPKTGDLYAACSHPDCVLPVTEKDKVELCVENKAPRAGGPSLFLYIYALGTSWEINGIQKASREAIAPKGHGDGGSYEATGLFKKQLSLKLEEGQDQCKDVLKIFLTAQPSSFAVLELPKLGANARREPPKLDRKRGRHASEDWAVLTFQVYISS
ncbi:hypothetical protein ACJ41O_011946 [Fusarium nematophilum]